MQAPAHGAAPPTCRAVLERHFGRSQNAVRKKYWMLSKAQQAQQAWEAQQAAADAEGEWARALGCSGKRGVSK